MAQHDYVIDNSTGANVRADINSALLAISSNNSGSSAPSTTYALQSFANTTDSMLQLRNAANNAFVNLRKFDGSLTLPDGSESAPSLFFDDDTNTGIYSSAADTLNITTGGSTAVTVDSSQRVGIGTTSPNAKLEVAGSQVRIRSTDNGSDAILDFYGQGTSNGAIIRSFGSDGSAGHFHFRNANNSAMTIDSSGNLGIGTTSPSRRLNLNIGGDQTWFQIDKSRAANEAMLQLVHTAGNRPVAIRFANSQGSWKTGMDGTEAYVLASGATDVGDGTARMTLDSSGNIGAPSGTNIFNASDSRVKTNVVDLNKGLTAIKSLRPVSFNWIDGFCDKEKNTLYGFIAQEVNSVDSNLIQDFATELTINENKIENVLRVNEKFIIPMLVKAIQELSAKVEALEAA